MTPSGNGARQEKRCKSYVGWRLSRTPICGSPMLTKGTAIGLSPNIQSGFGKSTMCNKHPLESLNAALKTLEAGQTGMLSQITALRVRMTVLFWITCIVLGFLILSRRW
jgi:hypothetical protein